jgi:hypothetical protein
MKFNFDKRLLGIRIECNNVPYLFLNTYLPCDNNSVSDSNYDEFMNVISCAIAAVDDHPSPVAYIIGDMNACTRRSSLFGRELRAMCDDNDLILSDVQLRNEDTFTFFSEAYHSVSWLDHCVSTLVAHQRIVALEIRYDILSSDHFPLEMTVCIPMKIDSHSEMETSIPDFSVPCWDRASDQDKQLFTVCKDNELRAIVIPSETLQCMNASCDDPAHKHALDNFSNDITNALLSAAQHSIPCRRRGSHRAAIPGWNELVRDSHAAARLAFLMWVREGKPRQGPVHQEMYRTRLRFKYAIRECKEREETTHADKLATDLLNKNSVTFWRDDKSQQSKKGSLPPTIDGISGETMLCTMWMDHYRDIFNSLPTSPLKTAVLETIERG